MNRYWKLISMVIIITLAIATFYVGGSMASNQNPDFALKKVSGDEQEIKNLSILGHLESDDLFEDTFHVNDTDTIYTNELTFFDLFKGTYFSPQIKQLQENYRNFMRGKEENPALFYEDEEYLVYVNGWDFHEMHYRLQNSPIHLEILDKKTKNVSEIQTTLPNENNYHYAFVEDVQKIDNQLKVVVRVTVTVENFGHREEIHLYTFDLNQQQLIEDEILAITNNNDYINIVNSSENLGPQKYLVLKTVKTKEVPGEDGIKLEEVERHYTLYHYETNEQKELPLDTESLNQEILSIDGSIIYKMNMSEAGLEIHPYDIESGKLAQMRALPIEGMKENDFPIVKVTENRLYAVSPYHDTERTAKVFIIDLNTWKTLYEGKIEQLKPAKNEANYFLSFYGIYLER